MEIKENKKPIILVFPFPLQGHLNPMFQLANVLFHKGFRITVIHTKFNSPSFSDCSNFRFVQIPDGLSEKEASNPDVIELLHDLNSKVSDHFSRCLTKILSEESVSCVIVDAHWYFTDTVTAKFDVPRLVLRTSNLCSFVPFVGFHVLRDKGYLPLQEYTAELRVPELPCLRMKDLPWIETKNPTSLDRLLSKLIKSLKASSGIIFNAIEELEADSIDQIRREFQGIPIFCIGPVHKYVTASSSSLLMQDMSCISWLDKQEPNSTIYISFGSIASITKSEFLEISWGLRNSGMPFLWMVRPGSVHGSEWIEFLPKGFVEDLKGRGKIVKWAPQLEVLRHVATGGFLTHCGWNSTLESICEAVPMICRPSFGDQRVNARYISDIWKIGLHLENKIKREEIEKAIRTLLTSGSKRDELRENIETMKKTIQHCLNQQGGSSYQSLQNLVSHILEF